MAYVHTYGLRNNHMNFDVLSMPTCNDPKGFIYSIKVIPCLGISNIF